MRVYLNILQKTDTNRKNSYRKIDIFLQNFNIFQHRTNHVVKHCTHILGTLYISTPKITCINGQMPCIVRGYQLLVFDCKLLYQRKIFPLCAILIHHPQRMKFMSTHYYIYIAQALQYTISAINAPLKQQCH